MPLPEPLYREGILLVEAVELVGLLREPLPLPEERPEKLLPPGEDLRTLGEPSGDGLRREGELPEFVPEEIVEVHDRDLHVAGIADVLRGVRAHVHLLAAGAVYVAREDVDGPLRDGLPGSPAPQKERVALLPEFLGDDRGAGHPDPLRLRLLDPLAFDELRVARAAQALRGRVHDELLHGRIPEGPAVLAPVAGLVQDLRHGFEAPVLLEEFVDEAAERSLIGVHLQALVYPAVPEGGHAAHGLPEPGTHGNRGHDPGGDLLPLPLGHRGDHGVEEAAVRGRGIDRLLEGDEIRSVLSEELGKVQKLLRVPRESRELREDEARDPPAAHVGHHPPCLRVLHDRLPGDAFEAIDLADLPAAGLRIALAPHLVVLRALALGLVFGRDPNPDAYGLRLGPRIVRAFHARSSLALQGGVLERTPVMMEVMRARRKAADPAPLPPTASPSSPCAEGSCR